jgi:hypothetical protein
MHAPAVPVAPHHLNPAILAPPRHLPPARGWVIRDTVYTHCWDRSGTRLFMAGGPLAVGLSGCSLSAWL